MKFVQESEIRFSDKRLITYPIGNTSNKRKWILDCILNRSNNPMYSHVIALVGRNAHVRAAIKRPSILDELFEENQQNIPISVSTVSKLFENVRVMQKNINQFVNCENSYSELREPSKQFGSKLLAVTRLRSLHVIEILYR